MWSRRLLFYCTQFNSSLPFASRGGRTQSNTFQASMRLFAHASISQRYEPDSTGFVSLGSLPFYHNYTTCRSELALIHLALRAGSVNPSPSTYLHICAHCLGITVSLSNGEILFCCNLFYYKR